MKKKLLDKRIKVGSWVSGTWASPHDGWYKVVKVDPNRKWLLIEGDTYTTPSEDIRFFTNCEDKDLLLANARRNRRDYIGSIAKA